jgi:hypothetical protein
MKTIVIVLGWAATQIQQRSTANLDIADLYDTDARHFRGPIAVQYQFKDAVFDLPDAGLASLSFVGGTLISATVNPHQRPLEGPVAAKLCAGLIDTFSHRGPLFVFTGAREFREFLESLRIGKTPGATSPPWSFGARIEDDSINFVIRPFEGSSSQPQDPKKYLVALEFGNSAVDEVAYRQMQAARAKFFANRRGRIRLSEYPKF